MTNRKIGGRIGGKDFKTTGSQNTSRTLPVLPSPKPEPIKYEKTILYINH